VPLKVFSLVAGETFVASLGAQEPAVRIAINNSPALLTIRRDEPATFRIAKLTGIKDFEKSGNYCLQLRYHVRR
jgi:hypothetical protein